MDCDGRPLGDTLQCILTYDGSAFDSALNYTLVIIGALPFLHNSSSDALPLPRVAALAFFCAFQLTLCVAIGCSGVSIVWAACLGAVLLDDWRRDSQRLVGTLVVLSIGVQNTPCVSVVQQLTVATADVAGSLALLFYAATSPPITTVAHICALAMGMLTCHGHIIARRLVELVTRWRAGEQHSSGDDRVRTLLSEGQPSG